MNTRKTKQDCCKSCGKKWDEHLGVEGTCKKLELALWKLELAREKLELLYLLGDKDIRLLVREAIKETKP